MLNENIIIIESFLTLFFICFSISHSLVEFILWLKFSTDKRQAENMLQGRGGAQGP